MHSVDYTTADVTPFMEKLREVLGEDEVVEIARRSGWLRRIRKIAPVAWAAAIVSTLGSGQARWLADIWRTFRAFTGSTVHYKPFHKQMAKKHFPDFFRLLFETALRKWTRPVLMGVSDVLREFRDVVIHDGTSFALKDALAKSWPGRFTTVSPAAVELHVTMSLLEDDMHEVTLTADCETERHYRPNVEALRGSLFLADRGYEERRFFFDLAAAGGFFIVRGTKSIRPTIRAAFDAHGRMIRRLSGERLSWDTMPFKPTDLDIEWRESASIVHRGRIIVIPKKDKRNRKTFIYLHTNLARDRFPATVVAQLYRLRWQVELLFKECKSHANLHAFDTAKSPIAEGLIWASLLAVLLKRFLTHVTEHLLHIELSTQRAAIAARHFLDPILRALGTKTSALLSALLQAIAFLGSNARRAHPARDRKTGRLACGLKPIAVAQS